MLSKRLQLAVLTVLGVLASRAYYQWLAKSAVHKAALHSYGEAAYWVFLIAPAVVLFVPFYIIASRRRVVGTRWVVAGAVLASFLVAYFAIFGDFLFCVFVTRGVCK